MKTIDIQQINTKRNPLIVYDESLNEKVANFSCKEKVEKANQMLKENNFFEKMRLKEEITKP